MKFIIDEKQLRNIANILQKDERYMEIVSAITLLSGLPKEEQPVKSHSNLKEKKERRKLSKK